MVDKGNVLCCLQPNSALKSLAPTALATYAHNIGHFVKYGVNNILLPAYRIVN